MNDGAAPIDVPFVIAPHALLLDIAGPASPIPTSVGLPLASLESLPEEFNRTTWIVLVGQPTVHVRRTTPEVSAISHWLSRVVRPRLEAADSAHRLLTICSGTRVSREQPRVRRRVAARLSAQQWGGSPRDAQQQDSPDSE